MKFSEHRLLFLNLCAGWCSCIGQREEVVWGMLGLSDQTGSVPVREVGGLVFGRPCVEAALLLLPAVPWRVSVANDRWYLWKGDHYLGDLVLFVCRSLYRLTKSTVQQLTQSIYLYLFLLFSQWTVSFGFKPLASSKEPISLKLKS